MGFFQALWKSGVSSANDGVLALLKVWEGREEKSNSWESAFDFDAVLLVQGAVEKEALSVESLELAAGIVRQATTQTVPADS